MRYGLDSRIVRSGCYLIVLSEYPYRIYIIPLYEARVKPDYSPADLHAVYARLIHHITVRRSEAPQITLL